MSRFPDFFIVGAMKCGTSSLHEQLALRSRLFMSEPKEPNFFSDDERVRTGLDGYLALFQEARDDQLCGESSTHYTKLPDHPSTVANLARHCPRARFIYVVRDPVERMASQYVHEWTQKEVDASFSRAVRRQERYVAYSSYARQLAPYLERFGPERVLVVFFERMISEPRAELERVLRFIGDPSPEPVVWSDSLGHQNASGQRMRKSALRDVLLRVPGIKIVKDRLPTQLREHIKGLWRMRSHPELDPETLDWARERLDADLKRFGLWLGRELDCRNFKEQALQAQADWVAAPEPRALEASSEPTP